MKRFELRLLAGVSFLVLGNVSMPAHAAVPAQQDQEGTLKAETPEAEEQKPDDQNIIVNGYRGSLATAQAIKRNSDNIVDAVVAQDIGKLPDTTAAESLARLPGLQAIRFADEVRDILVRGLPNVVTTFNGRDIFSAEQRRTNIQDFPAGALSSLEVYKSSSADLLEPGLAGLVNVRTRRPFDYKGFTLAGSIRGTYNDQSRKFDPQANLQISDRADTAIGEVGYLINGSYTQAQYRNATRWASGFFVTPGPDQVITPTSVGRNLRYPERVGLTNDAGRRWRPSVNASVQWKPASNLEFYYDFLFQGFRGNLIADQFEGSLRAQNATLSDVVTTPGKPDQIRSMVKSGGERGQMFRRTQREDTDGYQSAGGFVWNAGRAQLSGDLAYTRSHFVSNAWSFDTAFTTPTTIDVDFFADAGIAYSLPGLDPASAANYKWRGYYESLYIADGKGWQGRLDLNLDTDIDLVPKLQFGGRWTDRTSTQLFGTRYAYTETLNIPLSQTPTGDLALTGDAFRGRVQGWTQWLMPSRNGIAGNVAQLRALSRRSLQQLVAANPTDTGYADAQRSFVPENLQIDPGRGNDGRERTYAAYAQGKYAFTLGSIDVDGLVGFRVINTVGRYSGRSNINFNGARSIVPITRLANYVDVLPNLSMRVKLSDPLQIRFGMSKTRTRPDFNQLNPGINITQNTAPIDPSAPGLRPNATGSVGNPNLMPLTSKNYDATVEYYFSKNGSLTAAFFYRDLFGFIGSYQRLLDDPTYGLLRVSRPENAGKGIIKGAELAGQSFFDFLPGALSGFGLQGNITYVDARNRLPAILVGPRDPLRPIPGVSKWSYNASLFYEKGTIATRLSYNGRSQYVSSYGQSTATGGFTGEEVRKITRLDFSFNYTPVEALTLTFDATNLLAQPFNNIAQYADDRFYPRDVRDEGRYYGLGARFRF
jgi:TonB-dependent receptor